MKESRLRVLPLLGALIFPLLPLLHTLVEEQGRGEEVSNSPIRPFMSQPRRTKDSTLQAQAGANPPGSARPRCSVCAARAAWIFQEWSGEVMGCWGWRTAFSARIHPAGDMV
jgi:hypothetical protein